MEITSDVERTSKEKTKVNAKGLTTNVVSESSVPENPRLVCRV